MQPKEAEVFMRLTQLDPPFHASLTASRTTIVVARTHIPSRPQILGTNAKITFTRLQRGGQTLNLSAFETLRRSDYWMRHCSTHSSSVTSTERLGSCASRIRLATRLSFGGKQGATTKTEEQRPFLGVLPAQPRLADAPRNHTQKRHLEYLIVQPSRRFAGELGVHHVFSPPDVHGGRHNSRFLIRREPSCEVQVKLKPYRA